MCLPPSGLNDKVSLLKQLSIDIGTEVKEQNKFLDEMDSDFDMTRGIFAGTMQKLEGMMSQGGSKHMCAMTLFIFFFFLLIYFFLMR